MKSSMVSGAFQTARSTILVCILAALSIVLGFVCERVVFERYFRDASELMLDATSVASSIMLADERLTLSANMAARGGGRLWIDRYHSFIPDIEQAINTAIAMASPKVADRFDRETRVANDVLVEMEARSLKAAQEGDLILARTILGSTAYAQQKVMLANGTARLLESVIVAAKTRLESVRLLGRLALITLTAASTLGLIIFWLVTDRKIKASEICQLAAEQTLQFLASHDELTGLPNRRKFDEDLLALLENHSLDAGDIVAVAMVDVDHFKDVNDTLGHKYGDELIKLLPFRFASSLPANVLLARFGGDEFAIGLPIKDVSQAYASFNDLVASLSEPLVIDGHSLKISLSIGVALSSVHASGADDLLRFADIALYEAKARGRNQMCMFAPVLGELRRSLKQTEADLSDAIANRELELYYQPLFNSSGTHVTGLEALLRWNHPRQGLVLPSDFISVAEQSGLIVTIGEWVMQSAFEDSRRWPNHRISINLSPVQLRDPGLVVMIKRLISLTCVDPARFDFEITEGVLLENNWRVQRLFHDLRELGFGLSLDDFGTGYSSLSYLRNFPFTKLKIDKSFVEKVDTSTESAQIVYSILSLGRALGLSVTAEGIETHAQHHLLAAAGCQQMQGLLFSEPLCKAAIDNMVLAGVNPKVRQSR